MNNTIPSNGNAHKPRRGEHLTSVDGPLVGAYLHAIDNSVASAFPHAHRAANMARVAMEQSTQAALDPVSNIAQIADQPRYVPQANLYAEVNHLALLRAQQAVQSALTPNIEGMPDAQKAA